MNRNGVLVNDILVVLLQTEPIGSAPEYEFLIGHCHPKRLVLREFQHHEQSERLCLVAEALVVLDGQAEGQETITTFA